MTFSDQDLAQLYDIVVGRNQWAWTGPYFHTYPGDGSNPLHCACLELERRGYLARSTDEPDHVCWVAGPLEPPR